MIIEYHRPEKLDEAIKLLARKSPPTRPLGGGSVLSAPSPEQVAVVDIRALGLDKIAAKGKMLHIGAAATLNALLKSGEIPEALRQAIRLENAYSLRQVATAAGSLVAADGRSPFAIAMLALDAQLTLQPGGQETGYGDLLPLRDELLPGCLITQITLLKEVRLAYHYVARSPADRPIVVLAAAAWPSGRTRLALGGFGPAPNLVLDGQEPSGVDEAVDNALSAAGDQWASAEYRQSVGPVLAKRALEEVQAS